MATDHKFKVKNGLQTQNISFVDADTTNTITATMSTTDTLSFSGGSGQLFSISDSLSGTIFAVNDVSGMPSIEVDDDGTIRLAETSGNILIGKSTDDGSNKLQIDGNITATNITNTGNFTTNGNLLLDSTGHNYIEFDSDASNTKTWRFYNGQAWNQDALLIYNHTDDNTVLTIESNSLGVNRGAASNSQTLDVGGNIGISGTEIVTSARNLTNIGTISSGAITSSGNISGSSGHVSGKFAVKSTGVHASYDFYNEGTSYFNGTTEVNAELKVSSGSAYTTHLNYQDNGQNFISQATSGGLTQIRNSQGTLLEVAASGNVTIANDLTVSGNFSVLGTTTTLNTATLQVEDKNIVLNYGTGDTSSSANGAGITIQDAVNSSTDATILWNAAQDRFDISHTIISSGNIESLGFLQHYGYLYSRTDLRVLNAAANGWNTWATRSNGQFNLSVGTISSGAITTTTGAVTVRYGSTHNISLTPTSTGGVINARNSSGTSVVVMDARGTPFLDVTGNLKTSGTVRIDSSGNATLGTISSGVITASAASAVASFNRTDNDAIIELKRSGSVKGYIGANTSGDIKFYNSSAAGTFTISSAGNLSTAGNLSLDGGRAIFDTDTGSQRFQLNRIGVASTHNQALRIHVDDSYAVFESQQDETNRYGGYQFNSNHASTVYTRFQITAGNTSEVLMYNNTGTAKWQWDGNNNRQAINKLTPAYTLDVNGEINGNKYRIGGTEVIDNSRNLANIANLSSTINGNNTSGGNIVLGATGNNATKWHAITARQYNNSTETEGYSLITGATSSGVNNVTIGGGLDEQNAATTVAIKAAANSSTRNGTEIVRITTDGLDIRNNVLRMTGTTVIDANRQIYAKTGTQVGEDGTYAGYGVIGFGGITNGYNRVFGRDDTADGLYLAAATGQNVRVRANGSGSDTFILGIDASYSGYNSLGFGGSLQNGYNRIFAGTGTSDGMYINAATGRGIIFRVNGNGNNVFQIKSDGGLYAGASGGTLVLDQSRNLSNINLVKFRDHTASFYISPTNPNTLNAQYGSTSDDADIWINYRGYNDGFTKFRDFRIGDGKGTALLFVDGSTKTLQLQNGSFIASTGDLTFKPAAGQDALFFNAHNSESQLRLYNNRQDAGNVPVSSIVGYNSAQVAKMVFYRGTGGDSGFIRFQNKPTNASSLTDVFQVGNGSTVGYGVDILAGGLRVGGTEVIDSSGNVVSNYVIKNAESADASSGTWNTSGATASWGPKYGAGYAWTDGVGAYRQFNIPTGMDTCYLSQLQWSSGGYVDVHAVQSDGGLVFIKRISSYNGVEHSDEGNGSQHDGNAFNLIGSSLDDYTAIRVTNRAGRFHFTGLKFTKEGSPVGADGLGITHGTQVKKGSPDVESFNISGVNVINSARQLSNLTANAGTSGLIFKVNDWFYDNNSDRRFYFEQNGRTFYASDNGHQFRDSGNVTRFNVNNYGGLNILSGGDGHVASNIAIAVGGNTFLDSSRNVSAGTVTGSTFTTGAINASGEIKSTSTSANAVKTRFVAGAANGSTADGPLYLQYGKSQDIRMFEASGANRKLYIYGNDNGTDRWGGLSIATDGSFTVQASDTYLVLQAGSYVQSNNPHNFTSSILFSGTTVIDSSRNITGVNITSTNKLVVNRSTSSTTEATATFSSGTGGQPYAFINTYDAYHGIILRGVPAAATTYGVTTGNYISFVEYGGDFRFYKKNPTTLSLQAQILDGVFDGEGVKVNGTSVVDTNRNLTNIGTYTGAGDVVAQAANVLFHARSSADGQTVGFRAGYTNHTTLQAFFRYTTGDAQLYIDNDFQGNNGVYSNINFRNKANGGSSLINRMTIHGSTGNVNITGGNLQMSGTTVIDSSRNLSNINSIHTDRYEDLGGTFLFRKGVTSGTSRHINLHDGTSDPSNIDDTQATGITWGQRTDSQPYYMIYVDKENNGGANYSKLRLNWHTGIQIGAASSYGGTRFYNDARRGTGGGSLIFSVGSGDNHVRVVHNAYVAGNLFLGDGNDGYFYSDTNGRTAFAGGDFYIQNTVSNYYNYATNQYIGDSSGDNIYFRGNSLTGDSWSLNGAGVLHAQSFRVGNTSAWKIRPNSGNSQLAFEYSTSSSLADTNIKAELGSGGDFIVGDRLANKLSGYQIELKKASTSIGDGGSAGSLNFRTGGNFYVRHNGYDALTFASNGLQKTKYANGSNAIYAEMLSTDTLSFTGDSGQLFSISDSLSGTIFSVNDVSGMPSIEVEDDGTIYLAETAGNVLIGKNSDNGSKVQIKRTDDGNLITGDKGPTRTLNIGYKVPYGGNTYFTSTNFGLQMYQFSTSKYVAPCDNTGANHDNLVDLGVSGSRFDDIYATNGTIQTSDRNEKQDIQALTDAETRVATACKGLIRRYRWISSVEEKGDDARYHFGAIAQDVEAAFTAEGLDAGDYGLFIRSTWWEHEGESYPTAEAAPTGAVEKTRLGIRYNQLFAFIISAL